MGSSSSGQRRAGGTPYWALVALLVAFGFLAMFSIGAPFLLIGLALAFLWPVRRRPAVFRAVLASVFALIVGYVLAAPSPARPRRRR